jgi:hypothetical protein
MKFFDSIFDRLRGLRRLAAFWFLSAFAVFGLTAVVCGLFFNYDGSQIASLFVATLAVALALFLIIAFVLFLIWLIFAPRNPIARFIVCAIEVVLLFLAISFIKDPLVNLGEILEPILSFLK